ncbi:uncharacterized protein LOC119674222 [Teleopsis dalmanni]|uniref:uncharacterized protein LOC119674222 n=1 Tax=Teleopsis dalmanni TaxID=139649 RepID=UPI0018CD246B|nr:uncharacterized protein LOC119674222 [Teleopsis dalmanni]
MLNVIILESNYQNTTHLFHSYRPFPVLTVITETLNGISKYSRKTTPNLYGENLLTYPDQLLPRSILFMNKNGDLQMLGYVGRLLNTFAEKLNATLKFAYPVEIGKQVFFTELLQMTLNQSLDIPVSIASLSEVGDLESYTQFIEISKCFLTQPPLEQQINSFDDIKRSNLKVLMSRSGSKLLNLYAGEDFVRKYGNVITLIDHNEYVKLRNSFNNTEMAYAATTSAWFILEKQQNYFSQKVFRISPDLYFSNLMIYAIPLPVNSIYEESLNQLIGLLQSSGIFMHWFQSSFFDMVSGGLMSFKDLNINKQFEPLRAVDLYYIWKDIKKKDKHYSFIEGTYKPDT